MKTSKEKINEITPKEVSPWLKEAQERKKNRTWTNRSQKIAVRILREIRNQKPLNGMSQKMLAEKMGVTPQYINKVVKGKENLTLETISKIEEVLGISLLEVPSSRKSITIPIIQEHIYTKVSNKNSTFTGRYKIENSSEVFSESICKYG